MEFPTKYEHSKTRSSEKGCKYQIEYQLKYLENGVQELVKVGETNLYDYIQSFADSVDLYKILDRFNAGDTKALDKVQGFYADVSNLPDNMIDIMNLNMKGQAFFNQLDPEIKNQFGDNYMAFLANPELLQKIMKPKLDSQVIDKVEEPIVQPIVEKAKFEEVEEGE